MLEAGIKDRDNILHPTDTLICNYLPLPLTPASDTLIFPSFCRQALWRGAESIHHIIKTHVRGFFDTDLHEVSWHFATHEAVRPSEDQCQRSHSKWVFVFIPHFKSKYRHLIVSKLPWKSAICARRSPWRLIVLVRSLRSARLDTAWLVKSVTYFNLIG